ncbi:MAG: M3 family oligoendopeptidase [Candidatus Omnitrophica bacterium]|nr:M3 family oligoendopeptidase [Candidatus Omnitrophota bacterium]
MTPSSAGVVDFDTLKPYAPRAFVPENMDFMDIERLKGLYQQLLDESVQSPEDLEKWIEKRSELEAALDQFGSVLYIKMTCATDDEDRANRYAEFIEKIVPEIKPYDDQLNRRFLGLTESIPYDKERYGLYHRAIQTDVKLFVKENIPLETQVSILSQKYQKICGAMTVQFDGEEKTLPQMSKYLMETDRELREKAWRATAERRLQDKDQLEDVFSQMLKLRHQIAQNAGFDNYRDYKFKSLHRFDYTPEDCKKYHESMEKLLVPVQARILEHRREQLKVEALRPWDTAVDPLGRKPLKPFEEVPELVGGCRKIFNQLHATLGQQFEEMADEGLLDLDSRKGKAPGGYQSALSESRKPFIFMNAVGIDGDVRTLLHEAGHAFHSMACAHDPLYDYRHGPMEFNEVASMAMELLAGDHLDVFYSEEDFHRSRQSHLEDIIFVLIWVAVIDAFQHWIYENPEHTPKQRREAWLSIHNRFNTGVVDWSGLEDQHAYVWHRQLHIFEVPFYYIEYGIAQLGALQVWQNAKTDQKKALDDYLKGLSYGGAKTLPELYTAAGIRFDFSENIIEPLVQAVKKELPYFS